MNNKPTPDHDPLEVTPEEKIMLRQLRSNPLMAAKFQSIANKFEQEIANGMDAHQAEEAMIAALQELGKNLMLQWAENTQRDALNRNPQLHKHSKKTSVAHHLWSDSPHPAGHVGWQEALRHPFRDFAKVTDRSASRTLQRRIADFGAERSFQNTAAALKEHYNIKVSVYIIDKTTADVSRQAKHFNSQAPGSIQPAATLISEVDGSMLPIVGFGEEEPNSRPATTDHPAEKRPDRRKLRKCHWKEIRVSTVRVPGSVETWYGVAVGEPLAVGCMMLECCKFKGMGEATHIHALADGASWIAEQYDRQFGTRCKFHLDFLSRLRIPRRSSQKHGDGSGAKECMA